VRVLISGCGYVGSALGLLLADEGHTVFGLRRNTPALPPVTRPIQADLSAPLLPDTLPPDLDAVVYAASPGGATDEAYKTAYSAKATRWSTSTTIAVPIRGMSDTTIEEATDREGRGVGPGPSPAARITVIGPRISCCAQMYSGIGFAL
jgi:predicted dinucleotide-binding enzyme